MLVNGINNQVKSDLENQVHDLEIKIEVIEKMNRRDTIIVNNNNSISVPRNINVTYQCK